MDVQEMTREIRLQQWAGIVKECRGSGKTVKSWCTENGINEKSYFYWQKRVREAACQELTAYREQQVAKTEPRAANTPVFAECKFPENNHAAGTAVTIHLNGAVVEVHHGAEASVIESILHALRAPC